jgi:hypothetical protein
MMYRINHSCIEWPPFLSDANAEQNPEPATRQTVIHSDVAPNQKIFLKPQKKQQQKPSSRRRRTLFVFLELLRIGSMSATTSPSSPSRNDLLETAQTLCNLFATKGPLDDILECFSKEHHCCYEHGLPTLAPFLGRPFHNARDYFSLIATLLDYDEMTFFDYMVDVETRQVSVKGKARFTYKSTKSSWDEIFVYRLSFDKEAKITDYQVWADSGAAYLASKGEI